jgi:hypothetical protein
MNEVATILEIIAKISSTLALDEILAEIVEKTAQIMRADGCAISLWDAQNNTIVVMADYIAPEARIEDPFPYTLVAEGDLVCDYSADLDGATNGLNTATATLQNYAYDSDGNGTASGTSNFTGTANVDFSTADVTEFDECINVSDTNPEFATMFPGVDAMVCAGDAPKTFEYSAYIGPFNSPDDCGEHDVDNTASFITNDNGKTGEDTATVHVIVPCDQGCTLTPGYWKTHSTHGPAPNDEAWFLLGDKDGDGVSEGADETFFLSGKTYYQVLWTPPSGGNAYYILAHAYIAAKLNILNGATSTTQVNAAITWAETFFASNTPSTKLSKSVRDQAIANAGTLDKYNNGITGPGHCSE